MIDEPTKKAGEFTRFSKSESRQTITRIFDVADKGQQSQHRRW
jgi:hypothetical protein